MGRKELGLPYLPVEERGLFEVPVSLSFTSKEPELLLGCAGWNGRRNIFPRQELVGKETELALGKGRVVRVIPVWQQVPRQHCTQYRPVWLGLGTGKGKLLCGGTHSHHSQVPLPEGQSNINFYKDME